MHQATDIPTISIWLSFVLGALHALEPGHGKTALAAHLLSGKSLWRPALAALTTALSHSFSILLIATLVHGALDLTVQSRPGPEIYQWLHLLSGIILFSVGAWLFHSSKRKILLDSCACPAHENSVRGMLQRGGVKRQDSFKTVLLGLAIGMIPCPTALVALSQAILAHDWMAALSVTVMFSAGIFVGLFTVGSILGLKLAPYLLSFGFFKRSGSTFSYLQASVVIATGSWHIYLGL